MRLNGVIFSVGAQILQESSARITHKLKIIYPQTVTQKRRNLNTEEDLYLTGRNQHFSFLPPYTYFNLICLIML